MYLLEIDLLREGRPTVHVPADVAATQGTLDYLVPLADAEPSLQYLFWRISLREPLPPLLLPLPPDVAPVRVDLQAILDRCFVESGLGDDLEYDEEPEPPLAPEDAAWADELPRARGLRNRIIAPTTQD